MCCHPGFVVPSIYYSQSRFSIILKGSRIFQTVNEHWLQLQVTSCISFYKSQPVSLSLLSIKYCEITIFDLTFLNYLKDMCTNIHTHTHHFLLSFLIANVCVCAQSCLTLCDSKDWSPPGSSVHGIFQAKILEWVAIPFSRGSFQPRDQIFTSCISCIGRRILYHYATWEAPC